MPGPNYDPTPLSDDAIAYYADHIRNLCDKVNDQIFQVGGLINLGLVSPDDGYRIAIAVCGNHDLIQTLFAKHAPEHEALVNAEFHKLMGHVEQRLKQLNFDDRPLQDVAEEIARETIARYGDGGPNEPSMEDLLFYGEDDEDDEDGVHMDPAMAHVFAHAVDLYARAAAWRNFGFTHYEFNHEGETKIIPFESLGVVDAEGELKVVIYPNDDPDDAIEFPFDKAEFTYDRRKITIANEGAIYEFVPAHHVKDEMLDQFIEGRAQSIRNDLHAYNVIDGLDALHRFVLSNAVEDKDDRPLLLARLIDLVEDKRLIVARLGDQSVELPFPYDIKETQEGLMLGSISLPIREQIITAVVPGLDVEHYLLGEQKLFINTVDPDLDFAAAIADELVDLCSCAGDDGSILVTINGTAHVVPVSEIGWTFDPDELTELEPHDSISFGEHLDIAVLMLGEAEVTQGNHAFEGLLIDGTILAFGHIPEDI